MAKSKNRSGWREAYQQDYVALLKAYNEGLAAGEKGLKAPKPLEELSSAEVRAYQEKYCRQQGQKAGYRRQEASKEESPQAKGDYGQLQKQYRDAMAIHEDGRVLGRLFEAEHIIATAEPHNRVYREAVKELENIGREIEGVLHLHQCLSLHEAKQIEPVGRRMMRLSVELSELNEQEGGNRDARQTRAAKIEAIQNEMDGLKPRFQHVARVQAKRVAELGYYPPEVNPILAEAQAAAQQKIAAADDFAHRGQGRGHDATSGPWVPEFDV